MDKRMDIDSLLVTIEYNHPESERVRTEKVLQERLGNIQGVPSIFGNMFIYIVKPMKSMTTESISAHLEELKAETDNLVTDIEPDVEISIFNRI